MPKYNVECINCGCVSTVSEGPLWWRAKQSAEEGRLDAIVIDGVECGCKRPVHKPDAPYRVFGFTYEGREYDAPFDTFFAAVKNFRGRLNDGETAFIKGVSTAVENQLRYVLSTKARTSSVNINRENMTMAVDICVRAEPFQEPDGEGVINHRYRIVAEVKIDDAVVWTDTVETDNSVESVHIVSYDQYVKAMKHYVDHYYELGEVFTIKTSL